VAWDALAIIVHKSNPLKNLSTRQIKDIYNGKISNWKELGGKDGLIKLYARQGNISGVGYAIRQYIFKDGGMEFRTKYKVKSSGPLEKAVEKDPLAMGITGISSARKRNVKVIEFDGKQPTMDNLMASTLSGYQSKAFEKGQGVYLFCHVTGWSQDYSW